MAWLDVGKRGVWSVLVVCIKVLARSCAGKRRVIVALAHNFNVSAGRAVSSDVCLIVERAIVQD